MRKWLALGFIGLAVVWGPYVYTELVRSPERARGRHRHALAVFGDDEADPADTADTHDPAEPVEPTEPTEPAAEAPAATPETKPQNAPAAEAPDKGAAAESKKTQGPARADEAAKGETAEPEADEEPRPTWPQELSGAFHKAFDAETRDGFWAGDEETKLRASFRSAGVTDELVGDFACRKTVCRIAFSQDALEADVENKLWKSLQDEFGTQLALDPKHSEASAALYVLRKGYKLEH